MKRIFWLASSCAMGLLLSFSQAKAQVANFGNLNQLFRYGVFISGTQQAPVGFNDIDLVETYLEDSNLRATYPSYTGTQALDAVLDFRGLQVIARYGAGSSTLDVQVPGADTSLCQNAALGLPGAAPCTFRYTGGTRAQNYFNFEDDVDDASDATLARLLFRNTVKSSPIDPLAGNPTSLQGALVRAGLDLSSPESTLDNTYNDSGEPWLLGLNYSRVSAGRFDGDHWNARLQRNFRLGEGTRSMLKVNLPASLSYYDGQISADVNFGLGYEFQVIPNRWTLEPRLGYGLEVSPDLLSAGQIVSGSLTSRYRIDAGRGYVIVGNMVGYTTTLSTAGLLGADFNPDVHNTVFRNGLAYELPLKAQLGGRSQSLRASYSYTKLTGTDLYLDSFHEVGVSVGVRSRELDARNSFEMFRIGVSGTFGKDYQSANLTLGARF